MDITVTDLPTNVNPCRFLHSMVFFGEKMLSKKMMKVLKIDVIFIKNLKKLEKFEADCIWEDYNIRPKEFTIRIDWHMSEKRILQALAHEMTHIKQYSTGEMTDLMGYNQIVSWKRGWKRHRINAEKLDYWEHPWEIEAYGREKCLFEMFKEYWRKEGKNAEIGRAHV